MGVGELFEVTELLDWLIFLFTLFLAAGAVYLIVELSI
jgi:hypothetical protein